MSSRVLDDPAVVVDHAGIPRVDDDGVWDDELSLADLAAMGMSTTPPRLCQPSPVSADQVRGAVESGVCGAGLVERLAAAGPPAGRSEAELVDHVDWWGRAASFCQWMQAAEVGELLARRQAEPVDPKRPYAKDAVRDACAQVALALRLSPRGAENVVADSRILTDWPATAAAWRAGRIDVATARAISEEASLATAQFQALVEAAALAQAAEGAPARQVRLFTRRLAVRLDPAAATERAEAARGERGLTKTGVVDDMGELRAVLTADELKEIWDTVTARATALASTDAEGNPVSLDERRADVLHDLILHPDKVRDCTHGDDAGRWKTDLVVAASTLTGGDEDPAELVGHGPITAPLARTIAATSTWRALIIDDTGQLLGRDKQRHRPPRPGRRPRDHQPPATRRAPDTEPVPDTDTALAGRVTDLISAGITTSAAHRSTDAYRPTVAIRDHVEATHPHCRFPGCRRPSAHCDLDHGTAYGHGGQTRISNLIPLCRFHHRVKHLHGWTIDIHPDRSITWTTPAGHRYRAPPPRLWD